MDSSGLRRERQGMPGVSGNLHLTPHPQLASLFCFGLDLSACPVAPWRKTRFWGSRLSKSFQLGTCVRNDLRVTRAAAPLLLPVDAGVWKPNVPTSSLYCYKCVKPELWFPTTSPGVSLFRSKRSQSIFDGPCCSHAGRGRFFRCSPSLLCSFCLSPLPCLCKSLHLISIYT